MKERLCAFTSSLTLPPSSFFTVGRLPVAAVARGARVEVVALDHALQRRAVNAEDARGGLLVAARAGEDARDVPPFKLGEREQRLFVRVRSGGRCRRVCGVRRLGSRGGRSQRLLRAAVVV